MRYLIFLIILAPNLQLYAAEQTNSEVAVTFANSYLEQKDYASARSVLTEHLAATPTDSSTWNFLGLVALRAGDLSGATRAFKTAVESATGDESLGLYQYNLADTLLRASDVAGARTLLEAASESPMLADSAMNALEGIASKKSLPPPVLAQAPVWHAGAVVQSGYDSNVLLLSDSSIAAATSSGTASPFLAVAARGSRIKQGGKGSLDLHGTAGYTQEIAEAARSFNNLAVSVGGDWKAISRPGMLTHGFGNQLDYQALNTSGLQFYSWDDAAGWKGTYRSDSTSETEFAFVARYQAFRLPEGDSPDNDRTGLAIVPSVSYRTRLAGMSLSGGLLFEKVLGAGANYQSATFRVPLGLSRPFVSQSTATLGLDLASVSYPGSSNARQDSYLRASLGFSRKLGDATAGMLEYSFTKNGSNVETAAYVKHAVALVVSYAVL